jgi:hypothetical protein
VKIHQAILFGNVKKYLINPYGNVKDELNITMESSEESRYLERKVYSEILDW